MPSRRILGTALLLMLVQLAPVKPAMADQILINAGFETGALAPWRQLGTPQNDADKWQITSATAHSGQFSAMTGGQSGLRQDFAAVGEGVPFLLSFWVKASSDRALRLASYQLIYPGPGSFGAGVFVPADEWFFFQDVIPPTNAPAIGLTLFGFREQVTFFDDVRLEPVPEPATILLVGSGALLLARRRLKRVP